MSTVDLYGMTGAPPDFKGCDAAGYVGFGSKAYFSNLAHASTRSSK